MIQPYFKNIRKQITIELSKAQNEINIAVCWFTSKVLFEILCKKLSKNIEVNLIVLNDSINNNKDGLDFQRFVDLGGKFYFSDTKAPMHNKYCIIDNKVLINGSYNWTFFAETKNKENIMIIENEDIAQIFINDFQRLTRNCKRVRNVAAYAIFETQKTTIVENARLASDSDIIINSKEEINDSKITLRENLGLKIHQDKYLIFIPKNSQIPISKVHSLTTVNDDQTEINKDIRYGNNPIGSLNTQIGEFTIDGIPPMKKGLAGLITTFSVDQHGILTVSTKVKETYKTTAHNFDVKHLLSNFK